MIRTIIQTLDTIIFLWLAIKGMIYIGTAIGGYPIFWGCALICTAIYWKRLEKDWLIAPIELIVNFIKKR